MVIARERPGIYSSFVSSSITYSNTNNKTIAIVGLAEQGEQNRVYTFTKLSDAISTFGAESSIIDLIKATFYNGANKVLAVSAGPQEETSSYQSAFNALESISEVYIIVCQSQTLAVHQLLKQSIETCVQNLKERIGIVSISGTEEQEQIEAWAENFNSERMILIAQSPINSENQTQNSAVLAASLAGLICNMQEAGQRLNGTILTEIYGINKDLTEDDLDDYIECGVTPFENILGEISLIRAITSKTTNSGVEDRTFKELNTILIVDEIIKTLRSTLNSYLTSSKNNSSTRSSIASQTTLKLQEFLELGYLSQYSSPSVAVSEQDPNMCIVEVEFTVIRGLNQIYILAQIQV